MPCFGNIMVCQRCCRDSDLIVVMDQGQIAEQSTHEALPAQQGKYYALYMTQFAGFAA